MKISVMMLLMFAVAMVYAQPAQAATSCKDVEIIYARGSSPENKTSDGTGQKYRDKVKQILDSAKISVDTTYLGDPNLSGHAYPHVGIQPILTQIGAKMSGGAAFRYGESVKEGVQELTYRLQTRHSACPKTTFLLAGYSQGAQVVGQTLPGLAEDVRGSIAFVSLFGDPKNRLDEGLAKLMKVNGERVEPDACRGINLSPWRRGADCHAIQGSLHGRDPYLPDDIKNRVGAWWSVRRFLKR